MSALVDLGEFDSSTKGSDALATYDKMTEGGIYAVNKKASGATTTIFITYANQEAKDASGDCYVSYESAYDAATAPYVEVGVSGC